MTEIKITTKDAYAEIAEIANREGMSWDEAWTLYVNPLGWMRSKLAQAAADEQYRKFLDSLVEASR